MSCKPLVLLADDHGDFRREARRLLEPEFEIVAAVSDGRSALEAAERLSPDVAVLEVQMPVVGGIEAACRLAERSPGTKVVFLSSYQSPALIRKALSTGALGYVFKALAVEDLVPAIRTALDGQSFVSSLNSPAS
jgi:DNA-binding NarL/FixJ family response regulator